jgi:putative nucleotidyltransferase with HDIG domain
VVDLIGRARSPDRPMSPDDPTEIGAVQKLAIGAGISFADMMDAAAQGDEISPRNVATGAEFVLQAIQQGGLRSWLDIVWEHDDTTYQHCLLVAGLAASFASQLGFGVADRRRLTKAALLHDIGKAVIPLEILNKPGRLSPEETAVMQTHASAGYDILARQGEFEPEQLSVVRHHHEYLDGSGYPDGLRGGQIPDLVRMVTICDVYAALVEKRPYKDPMPTEKAFAVMAGMEGKLDMDLMVAFHTVVKAYAKLSRTA